MCTYRRDCLLRGEDSIRDVDERFGQQCKVCGVCVWSVCVYHHVSHPELENATRRTKLKSNTLSNKKRNIPLTCTLTCRKRVTRLVPHSGNPADIFMKSP